IEVLEQQSCGEKPERHAVAAIAKRKELMRVPPMGPDERQTVAGDRKQSFPCTGDLHLPQRGKQRLEVLPYRPSAVGECVRALLRRHQRSIASAKEKTSILRPSRVVIRTLG